MTDLLRGFVAPHSTSADLLLKQVHKEIRTDDSLRLRQLLKAYPWTVKDRAMFFHAAIHRKAIACVRLFVEEGVDVYTELANGSSLLHEASKWGCLPIFSIVWQAAAQQALVRDGGSESFIVALQSKQVDTLRFLLKQGVHICDLPDGEPALFYAISAGLIGIVLLFVEHGADIFQKHQGLTTLDAAYVSNQLKIAKWLAGAGVQESSTLYSSPYTHLCDAVVKDDQACVMLLLQINGYTVEVDRLAWIMVNFLHRVSLMPLFLAAGANVNEPFDRGCVQTAEHSSSRDLESVLHSSYNELGRESRTPLLLAVEDEEIERVRILLDYSADTAARDELGQTALHLAVLHGESGIIELLLKHGADRNAKSTDGSLPVTLTTYPHIIRLLEE